MKYYEAKECEKMFDYDLNTERLSQIKGHVMRRTYHKHEEFDADRNIINLKNGLYHVDNDTLKEHTPKYLSINQKPITYKKDAKAERFEQFLREVLYESIRDTAILKRLTGGSRQRIRIQRKNQRAYDTVLYAKLFFNANKIPNSEDESDAYNRRVIIITFPNRFEGALADKQQTS